MCFSEGYSTEENTRKKTMPGAYRQKCGVKEQVLDNG